MSENKSKFIRVYKRASKSPFSEDATTVLFYADSKTSKTGDLELSFTNYIYLHKNVAGKILGISISKSLLIDNPEFESQYLQGIEMIAFLLIYIEKIKAFCCLFKEEFESLFLLDPVSYFEIAESHWLSLIEQYE